MGMTATLALRPRRAPRPIRIFAAERSYEELHKQLRREIERAEGKRSRKAAHSEEFHLTGGN